LDTNNYTYGADRYFLQAYSKAYRKALFALAKQGDKSAKQELREKFHVTALMDDQGKVVEL